MTVVAEVRVRQDKPKTAYYKDLDSGEAFRVTDGVDDTIYIKAESDDSGSYVDIQVDDMAKLFVTDPLNPMDEVVKINLIAVFEEVL